MSSYIFDIDGFLLNASLFNDKEPDFYKDVVYVNGILPRIGDPQKIYIKDSIIYTFDDVQKSWGTITVPFEGQNGITVSNNIIALSDDIIFDCGTSTINV